MKLGTQYYRPPFPLSKYWEDDMRRMKDAGLNTVQLWVLWSWVEPAPGQFRFDDYDRLVELAAENDLHVVLSTIAEVQPLWIHREVPGSELVTHYGHKVISCARGECHFGLTPGGCTDHPGVWKRMQRFLQEVAARYKDAPNLYGWDAWNELRWDVHSVDRVCFCEHTLREYRSWLDERFGGLGGLNDAWLTRYGQWDEVRPGKFPSLPFTATMSFAHFTTWRACEHAVKRYDTIKDVDPGRPVTVHGGGPSADYAGSEQASALNRGNDWFFADHLDGVGTSSFPKWGGIDDAEFGARIEFVRSAARGKRVWLSELQGGRSASGFSVHDSVDALSQQRWIWNGVACGADTVLFWCWRDEVFCLESGGFGLTGRDGLAEERLSAMKVSSRVMSENAALIADYRPAPGRAGVLFSPQSYYLQWAAAYSGKESKEALNGYARALVKRSIPYTVVEEQHLDALDGLDILFLPRVMAAGEELEKGLESFVRGGGTLVCESETGAFSPEGFYREPPDRFTARMAGIEEIGRRKLTENHVRADIDGKKLTLHATQWLCPWQRGAGDVLSECEEGALIVDVPVDKGHIILCGSYFGQIYNSLEHDSGRNQTGVHTGDFELFVDALARRAGWRPEIEIIKPEPDRNGFLYVKSGQACGRKLVFVFFQENHSEAILRFAPGFAAASRFKDLMNGAVFGLDKTDDGDILTMPVNEWRFSILAED